MSQYVLYHNPRCSKSRQTLELLRSHAIEPEVILYIEKPPTIAQLTDLLKKLKLQAGDLLRKGESIYKEKIKPYDLSEHDLLALMIEHPKLIERPIFVSGNNAILGRPPENVLTLVDPETVKS